MVDYDTLAANQKQIHADLSEVQRRFSNLTGKEKKTQASLVLEQVDSLYATFEDYNRELEEIKAENPLLATRSYYTSKIFEGVKLQYEKFVELLEKIQQKSEEKTSTDELKQEIVDDVLTLMQTLLVDTQASIMKAMDTKLDKLTKSIGNLKEDAKGIDVATEKMANISLIDIPQQKVQI